MREPMCQHGFACGALIVPLAKTPFACENPIPWNPKDQSGRTTMSHQVFDFWVGRYRDTRRYVAHIRGFTLDLSWLGTSEWKDIKVLRAKLWGSFGQMS